MAGPRHIRPKSVATMSVGGQSRLFDNVSIRSGIHLTADKQAVSGFWREGPMHKVAAIGIGGSLAAPPLPHHRAYGSVHGGSRSCANTLGTRVGWAFGFMHRRERFDVFPSRLPGFTRRRRWKVQSQLDVQPLVALEIHVLLATPLVRAFSHRSRLGLSVDSTFRRRSASLALPTT